MKRERTMKAALAGLTLCGVLATGWGLMGMGAQAAPDAPIAAARGLAGGKKGNKRALKELAQVDTALGPLTEEQKTQVSTAIDAREAAMDKAKADYEAELSRITNLTPDQVKQKMRDARKATKAPDAAPPAAAPAK